MLFGGSPPHSQLNGQPVPRGHLPAVLRQQQEVHREAQTTQQPEGYLSLMLLECLRVKLG